jgi:hypothetical protein
MEPRGLRSRQFLNLATVAQDAVEKRLDFEKSCSFVALRRTFFSNGLFWLQRQGPMKYFCEFLHSLPVSPRA